MQTVTFDSKKLSLMELVMAIDSESVLDKVLGYARKKVKELSPVASHVKGYDLDYEEESMLLNEETVEAINEARNRTFYEHKNLYNSSEELFKALDAE